MKNIIKQLMVVLSRKQKWECVLIFITSLLGSMVELLGISAILPFAELLLKPDDVMNYTWGKYIASIFGFSNSKQVIIISGILIICIYILKNFYLIKQMKFQIKKVNDIRWRLSAKIIKSYMNRNYVYFTKTNSSILLRGIDTDVSATTDVMGNLFKVLAELMTVSLIIFYLFYTNVVLTFLVATVIFLCLLWFVLGYRKKIRNAGKRYNEYAATVSQCALQIFRGIKEIKIMHKENYFINQYIDLLHTRIDSESKKGIYERKPPYLYEAICVSAFIGAVCVVTETGIDIGELLPQIAVFTVAAFRIISSSGRISASINGAMFSRSGLNNVYYNILELEKSEKDFEQTEPEGGVEELKFQHELKIANLSWKYPERDNEVLHNINLIIYKGDAIAFVGPSGSGKTTMADIILGLFEPENGDITIDGKSIFSLRKEWSQIIGYVPQNAYLTDDTIRRNVAFGIEESKIDESKVIKALERAQIKNFVDELELGINTMVGEAGVRFSGGQRQRIAIARALYNDPDILVLDEATSALDNETEKALMESIENFYGEKTIIVIAHRLSTIEKCNKVYEVANGKLKCIRGDNTSVN